MYCNAYPNAVVLGSCNPDRLWALGSISRQWDLQARTVLWHGHCNHATNFATGQAIALLQGDMYFTACLNKLRLAELQETLDMTTLFYESVF